MTIPQQFSKEGQEPNSALGRFEASRVMDFDKWHDGIGYDLAALRELSPAERKHVEASLIQSGNRNWRDIEALAVLDTPAAREALRAAMSDPDPEVRNAVTRFAPHLISAAARTASLVAALESAEFYGGLTQTLLEVQEHHPPEVIEALLHGALDREGEMACHFAARLFFLHGKASSAFDWEHRPFFLRFNTADRPAREAVFCELCAKIGVNPAKFLDRAKPGLASEATHKKRS